MGRIMLATSASTDEEYGGTTHEGLVVGMTTVSGTTTSSGALQIPNAHIGKVISGNYTGGTVGLVFLRDDSYFTCKDNNLQTLANTSVTIRYYYTE